MVAVVDYGMGNLKSVFNAIDILSQEAEIVNDPNKLRFYERVILPGVGSFRVCMENLRQLGFDQALTEFVRSGGPLMGICLGMQIMGTKGFEDGESAGLNFIPGEIKKFDFGKRSLKIPHVGWNDVVFRYLDHPLLKGFKESEIFYFTHSFYFECSDETHSLAQTEYGIDYTAAILHENIFATQFHPEKSHEAGLRLLKNFVSWCP